MVSNECPKPYGSSRTVSYKWTLMSSSKTKEHLVSKHLDAVSTFLIQCILWIGVIDNSVYIRNNRFVPWRNKIILNTISYKSFLNIIYRSTEIESRLKIGLKKLLSQIQTLFIWESPARPFLKGTECKLNFPLQNIVVFINTEFSKGFGIELSLTEGFPVVKLSW